MAFVLKSCVTDGTATLLEQAVSPEDLEQLAGKIRDRFVNFMRPPTLSTERSEEADFLAGSEKSISVVAMAEGILNDFNVAGRTEFITDLKSRLRPSIKVIQQQLFEHRSLNAAVIRSVEQISSCANHHF